MTIKAECFPYINFRLRRVIPIKTAGEINTEKGYACLVLHLLLLSAKKGCYKY